MSITTGWFRFFTQTRTAMRLCVITLALAVGLGVHLMLSPLTQGQPAQASLAVSIELTLRDLVQRQLSAHLASPSVALIDIDERSLAEIGPWPWSRLQIAGLVEASLSDGGARIAVLDMVLPEPRDEAGDDRLAVLAHHKQLVLAEVLDYEPRTPPLRQGQLSPPLGQKARGTTLPRATGFMANHAQLSAGSACVGNIGFIPDPDGRLRRLPLYTDWNGEARPTLAAATLTCLGRLPPPSFTGQWPLSFHVTDESWPVIPASVLLRDPSSAAQVLHGRIALIGSSALGLADRASTPLSPLVSGMTIHAQMIEDLLSAERPQRLPQAVTLGIQILLALFLASSLIRAQHAFRLIASICTVVLASGALLVFGVKTASLAPLTAGLWSIAVLVLLLGPLEWLSDRARARTIGRILSRYVTPPILRALLNDPKQDPLSPQSARITVLTLDMVSYSSHTAALGLEGTARLTRQFLTAMTDPIWAEAGTLDRYTGDGLVAFWGAPLSQPDQVQRAVRAARGLARALIHLNQRLPAEGLPTLQIRIGIAGGDALVGDMGTDHRAHYTAVGACINLAARLETLAKELGQGTLVSRDISDALPQNETESLGHHDIRGFGRMQVFRLIPEGDEAIVGS